MRRLSLSFSLLFVVGCSGSGDDQVDPPKTADAGFEDAGNVTADAGDATDAGTADAATADAGTPDAGERDAGTPDAGDSPDAGMLDFEFESTAFADGTRVPDPYTCDGQGGFSHQNNPEIVWRNPPRGTQAFVMIFDDPDARNYPHWAFYTADATVLSIPEGTSNTRALPAGVTELRSGDRRVGYVPNCPSGRTHNYRWRIWAVDDANLNVTAGSSFGQLETAAQGASLGMRQFIGVSNAGG